MTPLAKVRIDKWLWSVRIFKTRTTASKAIKTNKVKIAEVVVKPSYLVTAGDTISVLKNSIKYEIVVKKVIGKRVGAPLAVECYDDITSEEERNKFNDWYIGKGKAEIRERGSGRPTKKERREIDHYKNSIIED